MQICGGEMSPGGQAAWGQLGTPCHPERLFLQHLIAHMLADPRLCVCWGWRGVTGAEREMNTPGPCPQSSRPVPEMPVYQADSQTPSRPSTKGYQCCVSVAEASI